MNEQVLVTGMSDLVGVARRQEIGGDVRQLPGELHKYRGKRGDNYKAAIVVGSGIDYQLLRFYVHSLKLIASNIKLRQHRSLDNVYQWIGE